MTMQMIGHIVEQAAIAFYLFLLNQEHMDCRLACTWFLEIALVCMSVCVFVCLPPRALITIGMIWCDIDLV